MAEKDLRGKVRNLLKNVPVDKDLEDLDYLDDELEDYEERETFTKKQYVKRMRSDESK